MQYNKDHKVAEDWNASVLGGSVQRQIVNPDLLEERAKCEIDQLEFEQILLGPNRWKSSRRIINLVKKHPELVDNQEYFEMSRNERMEHWWRRIKIVYEEEPERFFLQNSKRIRHAMLWSSFMGDISPITLHQNMFTQSIDLFGDEAQKKKWLPQADRMNIIGCYAQTEIGHGSNVSGLETTATLDTKTDEFVLHTPTIKATKFWPGTLGRHATHAIIFAQLIVDENKFGVQPFMVPIRSLEDHKAFPGVNVGDIGKKLGYNSMDNGFCSFDHYRIPRENMLSRFVNVDKEGSFEIKGDPRLIYQIMVKTRISLMYVAWISTHKAALIATRYAVCRRQFKNEKGSKKERKLLDYQTHMAIIAPHLAFGIITNLAARKCDDLNTIAQKQIDQGVFKMLDILHHFSSGFKAYCSEKAYIATDEMRQACGGAGYHLASGVASNWADNAPLATYEGQNTVMFQQSSRYLLKQAKKRDKGKQCKFYFTYINHTEELLQSKLSAKTVEDFLSDENVLKCMQVRSVYHLKYVHETLKESTASRSEKQNDLFALEIEKMTRVHLELMLYTLSQEFINENKPKDQKLFDLVQKLSKLFCLKQLRHDNQALYETGFFGPGAHVLLDSAFKHLLKELRPHMIPLAETCPVLDVGYSTIGNYYGDIVEAQLNFATTSKLNKQPVPTYYESLMKPVMNMHKGTPKL